MIFMIKNLLILLALSSCSYISYSQVVPMVKVATIGVSKERISLKEYQNADYSFLKVRIGRSANANLTLATVKNNILEWVSASNEKIYTFNGKIIKVSGIGKNISFITYSKFAIEPQTIDSLDVQLYNPGAVIQQVSDIRFVDDREIYYLDKKITTKYFKEYVVTKEFRWKYVNHYWVDDSTKRVIKSKQSIHPDFPDLEIEYFYK
jgi:hypothetical protein